MTSCYTALQREAPPSTNLFPRKFADRQEFGVNSRTNFRYFCDTEDGVKTTWQRNEMNFTTYFAFIVYPPAHGIYQCLLAWPDQPDFYYAHHQAVLYVQFQCK